MIPDLRSKEELDLIYACESVEALQTLVKEFEPLLIVLDSPEEIKNEDSECIDKKREPISSDSLSHHKSQ